MIPEAIGERVGDPNLSEQAEGNLPGHEVRALEQSLQKAPPRKLDAEEITLSARSPMASIKL